MHQPRCFREDDRARLHDLIERYSFGTLIVAAGGGELEISHLPFVLDRSAGSFGRLRVHVAAGNPIWKTALAAGRVTAVFAGPHAYVSAAWYEQPTEQVPTWNYAVVHALGTPAVLDHGDTVRLLDDLVAVHEGSAPEGWRTSLLAPSFRDELVGCIVGLSIDITSLEGKFKLSQNRSPTDRARVVEGLRERGGPDDAALVQLMSPHTVPPLT